MPADPLIFTLLIVWLSGLGLHSWMRVFDYWSGRKFDPSRYVTHEQIAIIRAERDAQMKETVNDIKADIDRIEQMIHDADLTSIHRVLGQLEGALKKMR